MTDADESNAARRKRYTAENGGSENRVLLKNTYYFPTGATAGVCDIYFYGVMNQPPSDKRELWRNKLIYREERLRRARSAFNELKRNYERSVQGNLGERNTPAPPTSEKEATAKLKELKKDVDHWQAKLEVAREKFEEHKPQRLVDRDETAAKNQDKNRSFSEAISKISI